MNQYTNSKTDAPRSLLLRASHILLLLVEKASIGDWATHPEKGFQRRVELRLKLSELLKGQAKKTAQRGFSLVVMQYDFRSPFPMPVSGVWSEVDFVQTKQLIVFAQGDGKEIPQMLQESACLKVRDGNQPQDALRLALRAEKEGFSLLKTMGAAKKIAASLDDEFIAYLADRLTEETFFQKKNFDRAMELLELPDLQPPIRGALLNLLRNRISQSQRTKAEHVCRLAVAMFRLLRMQEADALHDNLREVFLPNLLGLRGGGRSCSAAEIFGDYPEERHQIKTQLASEKQLSLQTTAARQLDQWFEETAEPTEGKE